MSLIMGLSLKDQFVLLSSDTKVTEGSHDVFSFEKNDDLRETGIHHDKIFRISERVLISTGGIVHTGELVMNEVRKRITPKSDLGQCAKALQEVTTELWNKRKSYLEGGESDIDSLALNFLGTEHFSCIMFGFFKNGRTGMVYIDPGSVTVKVLKSPMDKGLRGIIISPDQEDNKNYLNWFDLPSIEQTLNNYLMQFLFTHGKLSLKHSISVSPDCNMHIIFKGPDGKLNYLKQVSDSSVLYPFFKGNPEIDSSKLWRSYQ